MRAQGLCGGGFDVYIVDDDEELGEGRCFWRGWPNAALDAFGGTRVDFTIAECFVGVDRPVEELGVKVGSLVWLVRENLKLHYWIGHKVRG